MGITPKAIDTALNLAFGQAQVSTIYQDRNQYRVVMEAAPEYWQSPETLKADLRALAHQGRRCRCRPSRTTSRPSRPSRVNHQGQFAAATISFNLAPGVSHVAGLRR